MKLIPLLHTASSSDQRPLVGGSRRSEDASAEFAENHEFDVISLQAPVRATHHRLDVERAVAEPSAARASRSWVNKAKVAGAWALGAAVLGGGIVATVYHFNPGLFLLPWSGGGAASASLTGAGIGGAQPSISPATMDVVGCSIGSYFANASIGNQHRLLALDTGSSSTGVAYAPDPAAQSTNLTATVKYLDGTSWTGNVVKDQLSFAVESENPTAVSNVALNLVNITSDSNFLRDSWCDGRPVPRQGIIGLASQARAEPGTEAIIDKSTWNNFTTYFADFGGKLSAGGRDAKQAQNFTFLPLSATDYTVANAKLRLGSKTIGSPKQVYFDTGTNVLLMSHREYQMFAGYLAKHKAFQKSFPTLLKQAAAGEMPLEYPRDNATRTQLDASLPGFSVSFQQTDGEAVTLQLPATQSYLAPVFEGREPAQYALSATGSPYTLGFDIWGSNMMRNMAIHYDLDKARIGVAI